MLRYMLLFPVVSVAALAVGFALADHPGASAAYLIGAAFMILFCACLFRGRIA